MSKSDLAYIRKTYSVPAEIGGKVRVKEGAPSGQTGIILRASGPYLIVRMDCGGDFVYHPDSLVYLDASEEQAEVSA